VCGVEGICCDEACDAPCRSCYGNKTGAEDGQCLPVLPGKPDPKQTCKPQKACGPDGTCDGAGQCRAYAPKGTSCGSECKDDLQVALACDENGGCTVEVPPNVGCEGRGCDAQTGSCIPGCKTKSDCHDGYDCDLAKGTCVAEPAQCQGNSVVAAGKVTPCGAGQVCKAGACVAEGAGTGSGGASMAGAAPSGTTTDVKTNDGCGCRVAPERSGTGAAVGVLFALAAIVRRRHRPRSASRGPDA
jgi:MYXO-CTERM domain-containing protein